MSHEQYQIMNAQGTYYGKNKYETCTNFLDRCQYIL